MATKQRVSSLALKFDDNPSILAALTFIERLATFYDKMQSIGSIRLSTPQDYVDRYTTDFYVFDQLYRKALESYLKLSSDMVLGIVCFRKEKTSA